MQARQSKKLENFERTASSKLAIATLIRPAVTAMGVALERLHDGDPLRRSEILPEQVLGELLLGDRIDRDHSAEDLLTLEDVPCRQGRRPSLMAEIGRRRMS